LKFLNADTTLLPAHVAGASLAAAGGSRDRQDHCRKPSPSEPGIFEYHLTTAGRGLEPLVEAFGIWEQRWVKTELSLPHLDASLLMWDMRRSLNPAPLPKRRCVIQFQYPWLSPAQRSRWLMVGPNAAVDLCSIDPGFDVDLSVSTDLRDDGNLDGLGQCTKGTECWADDADRRSPACQRYADMARPQSIRPGKQASQLRGQTAEPSKSGQNVSALPRDRVRWRARTATRQGTGCRAIHSAIRKKYVGKPKSA
jgi:hypothetical protein